jgi:NADPH-dependent curcumin reductase
VQGFIVVDHRDRFPDFLRDVSEWMREHIVDGLDNAPNALVDLLSGRNFGKVAVRRTVGLRSIDDE